MRRAYWSLIAMSMMIVLLAAGCGGPASEAMTVPAATQAETAPTKSAAVPGQVGAEVKVEPAQTADLGFVIAAPVKQVNVKEGDQVKAGQALIVLDTPDLQYEVEGAQAELSSAQMNSTLQHNTREYLAWNGRKWIWTHGLPEVRNQADARVQQAQGALAVAQAKLAQGTLVAPFDGTVVSVDVVPGEMVEANKSVLVLGDLSHLQIATKDLSEREINNVRIGQTAVTRLKAFDQELPGKVIAISPLSEVYNGDTVFKVTIQLDQQPQGLLWGMTGDVTIETK